MKRVLAVALAAVVAASAFAQGTFTIRRPADGARVREVVDVRLPKNSIPEGGYLGIVVNGKFLEAVMPEVSGDDYVYKLDTKGRGIPDGETTIETILYMYSNNNPVVLNRSSVTVNVDNKTSIRVPENGFNLRYRFVPGAEHVYKLTIGSTISQVSQAQAQLGSRGREIQVSETDYRILWAVDNVYDTPTGREGLIRIQPLPEVGKGHMWVVRGASAQPELVFEDQLGSLFHRLTNVGREQFSSLPVYFALEGTSGQRRASTDWYYFLDFPILPTRAVKPGDVFPAAFNIDQAPEEGNLGNETREREKFYLTLPGRGVFEGVEWHNGLPCAKLSMTLQLGAQELQGATNVNSLPGETQSIKIQQNLWFALDRGVIVRHEVNQIQESLVEVQTAGAGGGPGGPDGATGGAPQMGGLGTPGGRGGGAAAASSGVTLPPGVGRPVFGSGPLMGGLAPQTVAKAWSLLQQGPPAGFTPPGGAPGRGGPGGQGGPGGFGEGGFGRGTGGGSVGVKVIQRVTTQVVHELVR